MSRATVLAEAIKDGLNGETFDPEFTAIRAYRPPPYKLKDLKTIKVLVIIPTITQEAVSRIGSRDVISIDIVTMQQVDPTSGAAMDALFGLMEDIGAYLRGRNFGNAFWLRTVHTMPYDLEDLIEERVFTGVIQAQYMIGWTA